MNVAHGLKKLNFSESFVLETNAYEKKDWAVLAHNGRSYAYMSKALGPTKSGWSTYSKVMLAIMEAPL